jgi:serine/threonine-protein kinase HipA
MKQVEVGIQLHGDFIAAGMLTARGTGRSERATFSYHTTYLANPNAYPISNSDDHLRNHGFLRDPAGNGWNLSPAFDVNPEPRAKTPRLSTPIRPGNHDADIALLLDEREAFRLSTERATQIMSEVDDSVDEWRSIADASGIDDNEQDSMAGAFRLLRSST